ncbi:MAG TPA: hypothetical protein VKM94_14625 [Blastocatellia bacterium]|nr:hypothetical protein [Blastocatellia bacterium]
MSDSPTVLPTLNRYIGTQSPETLPLIYLVGRDRRFTWLITVSMALHILFFAIILRLDWLAFRRIEAESRTGSSAPLVKLTELAAPPDRYALRNRPEPIERTDIHHLQFDPNNTNDQQLLSRSPRPSEQRGNGGRLPSPNQLERRLQANAVASKGDDNLSTATRPRTVQPPVTSQVQADRAPGNTPAPAEVPASRAAASNSAAAPSPPGTAKEPSEGTRRGTGSESSALGMTSAQGQYIAYVRAKIIRINEENMPRKWIEDVLSNKVSASFGLVVERSGRVSKLWLIRTSGYALLDGRAREAILLASPFEGYPQTAGDSLQFTVIVYYTPLDR